MATTTKKPPVKKQPVQGATMQLVVKAPTRKSSDVSTWRTALQSADMGRIKLLYDLYDDLMIDGVLADAVDKRIGAVTNSPITFQDANGQEVQEIIDLIDSPDFEELLTTIMNARFWGRSAGEFSFADGFFNFNPIPFKHIKLENQNILINETDDKGIDYSNDDQILVIGKPRQFGLFLKTAPFAIWKRGGFGDYAQWLELFGMPQRVGKYSSYDPESRKLLEQAMEKAGSAPWIVIPKEADVETVSQSNTASSSGAHNDFRKACNEEMLITVLGQTMTTVQGDKGARSLGEVHKAVEEGKNKSDMRYVRRILNWLVVPLLEKRGFPVSGGKFIFPESAKELAVADLKILSDIIDIPAAYVHDKYSIPVPQKGEQIARISAPVVTPPDIVPDKVPVPVKEKVKLNDVADPPEGSTLTWKGLFDFFVAAPGRGANNLILSDEKKVSKIIDIEKLFKQALNNIFAAKGVIDNEAEIEVKLFELTNVVLQHASESTFISAGVDWAKKNEAFTQQFSENTAVFSAFKSHEQTRNIVSLLTNEDGSLKSFSAFKKEALKLSEDYNKNWLQTEYNTAVRSARMAVNWKKFQETKRLYPNLEYMPSRAANPRESHTELYHCIWPMDDTIWDVIMPPSDWNCFCGVKQTDEDPTVQPEDWVQPEGDPVFNNNPGKTAKFVNTEATNYYKNTPEDKRAGIEAFALELLKQYES